MPNESGLLEKAPVRTRWLTGTRYIQRGDLERSEVVRNIIKQMGELDFSGPRDSKSRSKGNDAA